MRRLVAVLTVAVASLVAAHASAGIRGPCSATIAGRSVAGLSLARADAIRVARDANVAVTMAAQRPMTHYTITLSYGRRTWTIRDQHINARRWKGLVPVSRYSRYGTGYYKVRGTGSGPGITCSGEALIKVV